MVYNIYYISYIIYYILYIIYYILYTIYYIIYYINYILYYIICYILYIRSYYMYICTYIIDNYSIYLALPGPLIFWSLCTYIYIGLYIYSTIMYYLVYPVESVHTCAHTHTQKRLSLHCQAACGTCPSPSGPPSTSYGKMTQALKAAMA